MTATVAEDLESNEEQILRIRHVEYLVLVGIDSFDQAGIHKPRYHTLTFSLNGSQRTLRNKWTIQPYSDGKDKLKVDPHTHTQFNKVGRHEIINRCSQTNKSWQTSIGITFHVGRQNPVVESNTSCDTATRHCSHYPLDASISG